MSALPLWSIQLYQPRASLRTSLLPDFPGPSFPLSFSLDSSSRVASSVVVPCWSLYSYCPLSSLNSFGLQATDPSSDRTKQPTKTPPPPKSHKENSVIRVSEISSHRSGEDLRVPWTARRSNQPTLKEINPEYSLEGLISRLEIQYFGHLM